MRRCSCTPSNTPRSRCIERSRQRPQVSRPDRDQLVLRYMGPFTIGATLTYRQLLDQVDRFAVALILLGVKKGVLGRPDAAQPAAVRHQLLRRANWRDRRQHEPHLHGSRKIEHQFSDAGVETVVLLSAFYGKLKEAQPNTQIKRVIIALMCPTMCRCCSNGLVKRKLHEDGLMVDVPEGNGVYAFRKLLGEHPEALARLPSLQKTRRFSSTPAAPRACPKPPCSPISTGWPTLCRCAAGW